MGGGEGFPERGIGAGGGAGNLPVTVRAQLRPRAVPALEQALAKDPEDLLARMTTAEKIGQMIQPSFSSISPADAVNKTASLQPSPLNKVTLSAFFHRTRRKQASFSFSYLPSN